MVVVGAGLAGLMAARALSDHGLPVTVVERGRVAGGRLATRDLAGGRLDHGAQFFTTRSPEFAAATEGWLAEGTAYEWCRGFDQPPAQPDGYPRYAATGGMAGLAGRLAGGLDVRLGTPVRAVSGDGRVVLDDGTTMSASAVVLTAPVPDALALVDAGGTVLAASQRGGLEAVSYQPTIAVLVVLDRPSLVPPPGAVLLQEGPFSFVADNHTKGISSVPAVTLHASGELSSARWDEPDTEVVRRLLHEGRPWLGRPPRAVALERWRLARPVDLHPERCLLVEGRAPLVFAGDGFGEGRVEGAVRSGWAAAAALLNWLGQTARGPG